MLKALWPRMTGDSRGQTQAAPSKAKARGAACPDAGGWWDLIEPIIEGTLCKNGIEVFVCGLE